MSRKNYPAAVISRLRTSAASFARDEDGGATIWNVTWLLVFAGMAGLSIDSSNGYRNLAISQSSSDAASLAGVMQLPNPLLEIPYDPNDGDDTDLDAIAAAKAKAVEFSRTNMSRTTYGDVLTEDEVLVGNWEGETRTFTPVSSEEFGDKTMNAVRVYLLQNPDPDNENPYRNNGVPTSLMHMVGMPYWSVATTATAMAGYPKCAANAFMAHRKYCQTTNSTYGADVCLWADEGFSLQNGNTWNGNVAQTPPGANNSNNTYDQGPGFELWEDVQPSIDVQFVEDIATFNDGTPGIAYDILSGGSSYSQKVTTGFDGSGEPVRAAPGGEVVRLQTDTIGTTDDLGWLDTEPSFQVASLDGFASIAGLLAVAKHPTRHNIPEGCPSGRSKGSLVEPIGDFDYEIFGIEKGGEDLYPDVQFAANPHTSPDLTARRIYYHDTGGDLTIDGDLEGVVVVTTGSIIFSGDPVLTDVTLVSLQDGKGGHDGISMEGADATFGTATGECEEVGGVKMYTMGSVGGSSGTQFNGALLAAGGNVGFAANSDSEQGVSVYSAGNIFHTSNNTITSCGVPITFDPDNLRYSIVD